MIAIRIYWAILILSIILGVYFYGIAPERYNLGFLLYFALVPFLMFSVGVHGLLNHLLKSDTKSRMLIYPLIMGVIFMLLFVIHIFIILPIVCPGCMGGFKY
jgi:hypothetical protein